MIVPYIWFGGRTKTCQTDEGCDKQKDLGCLFGGLGNGSTGRAAFSEETKRSVWSGDLIHDL